MKYMANAVERDRGAWVPHSHAPTVSVFPHGVPAQRSQHFTNRPNLRQTVRL